MIYEDEPEEKPPLWRRIGVPVGGIAAAGLLAWLGISLLQHPGPASRPHQEPPHIVTIKLPPPPPPPPPPPQQPQKPEPTRQMPSPVKATMKSPPKAPAPPAALTTSIQGAGNSGLAFGQGGGGGDCIGAGCGTGDGGGGDTQAYFAGLIKSQIEAALARSEKLRTAHYRVTVALLMDQNGHAVRATVRDFTGDPDLQPEIDRVLLTVATNEKLPPDIASQPVLLRINAHARG